MRVQFVKRVNGKKQTSGATVFECAILMALVAVVCIVVLSAIGSRPTPLMSPVNDALAQ